MKKLIVFFYMLCSSVFIFSQQNDWSAIEKVFGKKGTVQNNVFRIAYPRSDLKVKVGDFSVSPGLALGSWVGIMKSDGMNGDAMMMGDLVLLEKELKPVVEKLISENLQITAIHNHLINETPAIKYVHFSGKGNAVTLAESIKSVLSVTGTPLGESQASASQANPDWSGVESVLGTTGKKNGNLLNYSFPRKEKLLESGMEMPPLMGMATGVNFQMEGKQAAITGDFVLLADEVNPVLKKLIENGITVTAVHNHMLYDEPRLFMMHFWAVDNPAKLAKGIKAALDVTNMKLK